MYYANVNVNLMEERVNQSKTGITINTNNASVKPWVAKMINL